MPRSTRAFAATRVRIEVRQTDLATVIVVVDPDIDAGTVVVRVDRWVLGPRVSVRPEGTDLCVRPTLLFRSIEPGRFSSAPAARGSTEVVRAFSHTRVTIRVPPGTPILRPAAA